MALEELSALRKQPGPLAGRRLAPSLLKHAEEQTVLAVAAILRIIAAAGWQERDFSDWAVIAAPRFPGRLSLAPALEKFQKRGAASVSPLIVPTLSLHAMAGTLSLVLGAHGFHFGVGGGHDHLAEALLCALAFGEDSDVPGVWVVATEWEPEPIPEPSGASRVPAVGTAIALGLAPRGGQAARWRLRLAPLTSPGEAPPSGVRALAGFLQGAIEPDRPRCWSCRLPGRGAIVLDDLGHPATQPLDGALPARTTTPGVA